MVGEDKGEDRVKAVSFAAGTAAFMACIERAVVVSVFVHWRVWAFIALNLLLLAILFTSKSKNPPGETNQEDSDISERKRRRQECCSPLVSTNGGGEMAEPPKRRGCEEYERKRVENGGKIKEDDDDDQTSKDELNKRAEAFIAMFRQHLVYDAKGYYPAKPVCVYQGNHFK